MRFPDCKLIDCEQGTEAWHKHRKGYLTASNFGDWLTESKPSLQLTIEEIKQELSEFGIKYPAKGKKEDYAKLLPKPEMYMDQSKGFKSAQLTAASKCLAAFFGVPDPDVYESEDIKRGKELEPLAREEFAKMTGLAVDEIGFAKSIHGWFGCSPDGIMENGEGLEINCPRPSKLIQYHELGDLPDEYKAQVHGSMAVTGAEVWHFFAWYPGFPAFHHIVKRDTYTESMLEGLKSYSNYYERLAAKIVAMNGGEV
jgi:hypothetical protein